MPSNLPVNESRAHYDMWTLTDQPGFDMFQSRTLWRELSEVSPQPGCAAPHVGPHSGVMHCRILLHHI